MQIVETEFHKNVCASRWRISRMKAKYFACRQVNSSIFMSFHIKQIGYNINAMNSLLITLVSPLFLFIIESHHSLIYSLTEIIVTRLIQFYFFVNDVT